MTRTWFRFACLLILPNVAGCFGHVERDGGDDPRPADRRSRTPSVDGTPCEYFRGEVTLEDYDGENNAGASFSFEFATQDPDITRNEYDVQYGGNMFRVNLITDDVSFIVDLGNVDLVDVPVSVDPSEYELGNWGTNDNVGAVLGHTYFVRNQDSAGRTVAAFRVTGLEPGERASISWMRSTDPDQMFVPTACGL